jgi:uncharacterized membrane protein
MRLGIIFLLLLVFVPSVSLAQTADVQTIAKAKVVQVISQMDAVPRGTATTGKVETIKVQVLEGSETGTFVTFDNGFTQLKTGDIFYLRHLVSYEDARDYYTVADPYRLNGLYAIAGIFLFLLFFFGGLQGLRGLLSLAGSFFLIFYLLIPGILHGYSPALVSIGVSSLIVLVGSYITHGFNRTTTVAVIGMLITIVITGLGAVYAVYATQLSGYNSEVSTYLHYSSYGTIDLTGVLLGGILIGLLGVLYDIAIGQAVFIEEMFSSGPHLTKREGYEKAIRIGREHIGALVNTLAIAYVGAFLPLLLLFSLNNDQSLAYIANGEVFATEIVRILIGGIGLILAVPITSFLGVYMLHGKPVRKRKNNLHAGHTH